jgi:NRPS condensation-like uncharacterized protein
MLDELSMIAMQQIPKYFPTQATDRFINHVRVNGEMMIQMEMEFEHRLDDDRLAKALDIALDTEPIFGCRFVPRWWRPCWERLSKEEREILTIARDVSAYEEFRNNSIDACSGPQIKACLLHAAGSDCLLLKVTHEVADATGVRQMVAMVASIYSELSDDPAYRPDPTLIGSRSPWQVLRYIPRRAYPGILFYYYFRYVPTTVFPLASAHLPMVKDNNRTLEFLSRRMPVDLVDRLVEYGHQHKVTLNDIMLASFLRSLTTVADWDRKSQLRLAITVDLRRYMPDGHGEGICNLSGLEILNMGTDLGDAFHHTLDRVSSFMRYRKARWIGLSDYIGLQPLNLVFPYAPAKQFVPGFMRFMMSVGNSPSCFTNMGVIDREEVSFDKPPVEAMLLPPVNHPPQVLFSFSSYNGSMTISSGVWASSKAQVAQLLDNVVVVLEGLASEKA